jgi:hypothetical protein
MTPGILTAIISALTALAIPAALACFVLAGLRLRAEGGVNYDAGGGFFKWLLWAAVFLTLPGISLWLSNNGVPTLPSSSSGGTYAYITGWQTVLTAFVNDIVIQHLVPVLAATLVVKAILDWAEGNSPIPSVITSLCLLGVQGIDSLATGSWLISGDAYATTDMLQNMFLYLANTICPLVGGLCISAAIIAYVRNKAWGHLVASGLAFLGVPGLWLLVKAMAGVSLSF